MTPEVFVYACLRVCACARTCWRDGDKENNKVENKERNMQTNHTLKSFQTKTARCCNVSVTPYLSLMKRT